MKLKSPEEVIKNLVEKYTVEDENIFYLNRLFMAASVVRWAFKVASTTEEIIQYLSQVEKYLSGQIELYWQDGVIKVGRVKRGK